MKPEPTLTRAQRRRFAREHWKAFCKKRKITRGTDKAPPLGLVAKAIESNQGLVETR
jgi:hypothetical protein